METMSETSLLGVIVSQDLKWNKNTSYICMKARRKLWVLRRLMQLHLTWVEMFDVYKKEVRSILEFAVPVWHSSITKKQSSEIEAIQKLSFRIILGPAYKSYHNACAIFETHTLEQRRLEICKRFVTKNLKSEDHCLFTKTENNPTHLRQRNRPIVVEQKCNTVTFQRSSLPFLSNLANSICSNSKSWYCLICFCKLWTMRACLTSTSDLSWSLVSFAQRSTTFLMSANFNDNYDRWTYV